MLDKKIIDLINQKNFAMFGTISQDGHPHVTPTWVDTDGSNILINTSIGRVKQKNAERNNKVSVTVQDQKNPYTYAFIQGTVIEQRTEGADEHIDKLAKKYTGADKYQNRQPGEKRVILVVKPDRIYVQG